MARAFHIALVATLLLPAHIAGGQARAPRGYFAAPNGSRAGDGGERRPWDLATALAGGSQANRVQPGDTIWLRGGTYRGGFRATVAGREGAPVVVRQFPGERAVIDGATAPRSTLYVMGNHTVFWGFELTNTDTARTTSSPKLELRHNVVVNDASHTKYINLVVHDGGVGFYNEPKSIDVEISGCIVYNNGYQAPDRGHGHGLYLKAFVGPLVARDNVIFNQYGYGIHAYTNSGTGKLMNITIEGNVAFNNGTLATRRSLSSNILLGGADYAGGDVVRDNIAYYSPELTGAGANVVIGYRTQRNGDVVVEHNYFVGGSPVLDFGFWAAARVSSNTLIRTGAPRLLGSLIQQRDAGGRGGGQIWRDNDEGAAPAVTNVVVRPNLYEPGRAHVTVINWGKDKTARVDVRGVLEPGDRYEVHNVQDLFGPAVASGTVSGSSISIPLNGVAPPAPVGRAKSPAPRTGPSFDVFLVTRSPQE
jgi:ribosomal protein L27